MGNNAIAKTEDQRTDMTVLPPRQPIQATARQVLLEHAEMAQMAWDFAVKVTKTSMVPARFRDAPEEATAAILYGAELGLPPILALQNIFEVHGTPAVYARTMQALLEAKGFHFKVVEESNTVVEVVGWKPGTAPINFNDPDTADASSRWTIADAELAGFTRNEKYRKQPRQMLYAKAITECCRRLSPATLLGIAYSAEELQLDPHIQPVDHCDDEDDRRDDVLTVEEILGSSAGEAAPREPAVQEDLTPKAKQPKQSRVEKALAKARAEAAQAATLSEDTNPAENAPQEASEPDESPALQQESLIDAEDEEVSPDPSEEEPAGDDLPEEPREFRDADSMGMGDEGLPDAAPSAVETVAAEKPEPSKADQRPATKAQLQELAAAIGQAGFQPTDEGRAEWFAYATDVVGREIRANNQLLQGEIKVLIGQLAAEAGSR